MQRKAVASMMVTCSVCYELITFDNVHAAPCGHILHSICWTQWLLRTNNCPYCGKTTLAQQLVKLIFNIEPGEDYNTLRTKCKTLTKTCSVLKNDLRSAEDKLLIQIEEVKALRQQVQHESEGVKLKRTSGKSEWAMKGEIEEDGNPKKKKKREERELNKENADPQRPSKCDINKNFSTYKYAEPITNKTPISHQNALTGDVNSGRQVYQLPGRYPGANPYPIPPYQYPNIPHYAAGIGLPGGNPSPYPYPYPAAVHCRAATPHYPTFWTDSPRTSSASTLQLNGQYSQYHSTGTKTVGTAPAVPTRSGVPTGTFHGSAPYHYPGAVSNVVNSPFYPAFWTESLQPTYSTSSVQSNGQNSHNISTETKNTGVTAPVVTASSRVSIGTCESASHLYPGAVEKVTAGATNYPIWTETLSSLLQANNQYFQSNWAETNYRSNGAASGVPKGSGVQIDTSSPPISPSQPLLPGVSGDPATVTVPLPALSIEDLDSELPSI